MHRMLVHVSFMTFISLLQGGSCAIAAGPSKAAASDFVFLQTAVKTSKKAEDASKSKAGAATKKIDLSPEVDLEGTCGPLTSSGILAGLEECHSLRPSPPKSNMADGQAEVLNPTMGSSRLQTGTVVKKVALTLSEDEED
mmetsp:Transcript_25233/g.58080  ORF Transcript_25233/g.58080 Transcript_25233/m.58080 type:complete len:140 (-) Transcript_25233:58-477(-)